MKKDVHVEVDVVVDKDVDEVVDRVYSSQNDVGLSSLFIFNFNHN